MAEEKEAKESQKEKKPAKKDDEGSPIVMYAVIGVLSILAIYGGYIMSKYTLIPNFEEVQAQKLEAEYQEEALSGILNRSFGISKEFKNIMVNPAGSKGMNVVQASFVVEADDQLIMDEISSRETQFKDLFISYLRRHTIDQLASMEFQLKSKRELALEINKMLNAGNIDSIYYSGFFIQ
jgi:flagellar basal body-associated protein FliL